MHIRFALMLGATLVTASPEARAEYMTGGGAGAAKCPELLNALATARQAGGLETPSGAMAVLPLAQYLAGFITAANMISSRYSGHADIFERIAVDGRSTVYQALYAMEPWCAENPAEDFDAAIIALISKL